MDIEQSSEVNDVMKESFRGITDPRQQAQVRHDLYEIIAMPIAAVIGNCDGWDEIEDFCRDKETWLRGHMGLKLEYTLEKGHGRVEKREYWLIKDNLSAIRRSEA